MATNNELNLLLAFHSTVQIHLKVHLTKTEVLINQEVKICSELFLIAVLEIWK